MSAKSGTLTQFQKSWKRVLKTWRSVKTKWNDSNQKQFEKTFWLTLEQESKNVEAAMMDLAKVLDEARRQVR